MSRAWGDEVAANADGEPESSAEDAGEDEENLSTLSVSRTVKRRADHSTRTCRSSRGTTKKNKFIS